MCTLLDGIRDRLTEGIGNDSTARPFNSLGLASEAWNGSHLGGEYRDERHRSENMFDILSKNDLTRGTLSLPPAQTLPPA
jgi:hypothetical protein